MGATPRQERIATCLPQNEIHPVERPPPPAEWPQRRQAVLRSVGTNSSSNNVQARDVASRDDLGGWAWDQTGHWKGRGKPNHNIRVGSGNGSIAIADDCKSKEDSSNFLQNYRSAVAWDRNGTVFWDGSAGWEASASSWNAVANWDGDADWNSGDVWAGMADWEDVATASLS